MNVEEFQQNANLLRALSILSTSASKSGHPTSCMSAADILAVLFSSFFNYDLSNPHNQNNDRFILSKGHAAPLLYSVFSLAGALPRQDLLNLRKIDSPLEGHPTPSFPFAEAATGSLGQGLSIGAGIALYGKRKKLSYQTFVLIGDGEMAEGQVYEAGNFASQQKLDNLVAIVDVNGLGQTGQTAYFHDTHHYENIFRSLGFLTAVIDGHNYQDITDALEEAKKNDTEQPYAIIAKTLKGKGVKSLEGNENFHGKPVEDKNLNSVLKELGVDKTILETNDVLFHFPKPEGENGKEKAEFKDVVPSYNKDTEVATREAFGEMLEILGKENDTIYAIDGDVANSTYTDKFGKSYPERFVEGFIAEQNMVGVGVGLSRMNQTPFIATFGAFLTRAHDQLRMAAISKSNLKVVGSHAGVSIGEDGPSQMALEDIAMFSSIPGAVVLHPADAVSCAKLVSQMVLHEGISYLRTLRPKTKVLYDNAQEFVIGGSKILRKSEGHKLVIVASGITVHESLTAYEELKKMGINVSVIDAYSIRPIDKKTILDAVSSSALKTLVVVEDHYEWGGLGDAVLEATVGHCINVVKLAVSHVPKSGSKDELFDMVGISSHKIVEKVKGLVK